MTHAAHDEILTPMLCTTDDRIDYEESGSYTVPAQPVDN